MCPKRVHTSAPGSLRRIASASAATQKLGQLLQSFTMNLSLCRVGPESLLCPSAGNRDRYILHPEMALGQIGSVTMESLRYPLNDSRHARTKRARGCREPSSAVGRWCPGRGGYVWPV